jgi:hypothetical protein
MLVKTIKWLVLVPITLSILACQTIPTNGYATINNGCGGTTTATFVNGLANGQGTAVCANGEKYVGEFKDGKFDGWGTLNLANGEKYEGGWKNNMRHGKGTNTTANGERYEGEIRDGKRHGQGTNTYASGDKYVGEFKDDKRNGQGTYTFADGKKYIGEYKDDKYNGLGTFTFADGSKYVGEFKDDKYSGLGIFITADGRRFEGVFENNNFIREAKVNLTNLNNNVATSTDRADIDRERQQLAEERRRLEDEKRQREQARNNQRINLQVSNTVPTSDGSYTITIRTNSDTASLKLNGEELGGRADGVYVLNRVARVGQDTKLDIVARDVFGNTDTKSIVVTRTVTDSAPRYASLDPARVKTRASTDSVAIIIGIQNYKRVPKAEFANSDASAFYDYAIRALGVKPENIKLMLDEQADEIEILSAFKNWLPVKVKKARTDVYIFYSGHGLPGDDGKSLYILPFGADRQFIDKTALNQQEIITAIQSVSPKSVTMFMDACYSGQIRNGDTLLASARPVSIKASANQFPAEFTVFTASASDQIASSSPELKHGIFSYYVMKGMEGDADNNQDGRITTGELQQYLSEMVGRQAMAQSRNQKPQLVGDSSKVLVGK